MAPLSNGKKYENKVVFITGASSGIGASLAREFARGGARVALAARRLDKLEALSKELGAFGAEAAVVLCDVTKDESVQEAVQKTLSRFGAIDVVIANAGFGVADYFERLDLSDYQRQFDTNVYGVLRTIYASLPALKKSKGRLALMGSVAGYVSMPQATPYCMSKAALMGLAMGLDLELRPRGVSVTHIQPGFIDTEIFHIDNQGKFHEHAEGAPPQWLRMPAETAARKIADAIWRRKPVRVITGHGMVAASVQRHFPRMVRGLLTLASKKVKLKSE